MTVDLKVPRFPESIQEGTLMAWHKAEGDAVQQGDKVADIETDKVVLEVAATESGRLTALQKKAGETVRDGDLLARIETDGAKPVAARPPPAAEAKPAAPPPAPKAVAAPPAAPPEKPAAAPASTPRPPAPVLSGVRPEERVPMTRLRARIAERLVQAQHTAAMLTTFNEVNMQAVIELRGRLKERFQKEHGVKLGFMSFFVKAAVEALKQFPVVNASVDGTDIVYHGYFDIGIAVSTPRGLVVPVLRQADRMSFAEIEKAIEDVGQRAQAAQLTLEELTGGTFTITNGGVFGSMLSTPILNPPQSAILGLHKIQERPVAENGQCVIRPVMFLALSYDHRIIDGREAVLFLVAIKDILEDPTRLLLQV
jgi:2-oxoglutarate dehydrogenase E2 component (dihydrolipoamide succinyltransferase)